MILTLPYPPSVNRYYRHVGFRTLISREGRAYRTTVCSILRRAGIQALVGTLAVGLDLYPPDRRTRDADNVQKALLDALQHGGVYRDDSQVKKLLTIMRDTVVPGGKVVVCVFPLNPSTLKEIQHELVHLP
ncbi:MAG TPA: RusA family crossover junction endodeoxyribonuclease [Phycisphaerae bacterium]|nr:RusA family crossover junction endodeoxyribonuclease [Phycisphaerae bacterium]HQL76142.1 RusA family crossover junction endodeoxyribonuclease [Phycisphaerae bacterium]